MEESLELFNSWTKGVNRITRWVVLSSRLVAGYSGSLLSYPAASFLFKTFLCHLLGPCNRMQLIWLSLLFSLFTRSLYINMGTAKYRSDPSMCVDWMCRGLPPPEPWRSISHALYDLYRWRTIEKGDLPLLIYLSYIQFSQNCMC